MSEFLTKLDVEKEFGVKDRWKLLNDFCYKSDLLGKIVCVPKGFSTDFASVPRIPVAYWLTGNTAHEAAVIHDFLYKNHAFVNNKKSLADNVFLEAMRVINDPKDDWKRRMMYRSVLWFGWLSWWKGGNSKT